MVTKEQLDEIIAKYNRGEPTGYSDEEYDRLLEEYLQTHGGESARPFNRQQQSDGVNAIMCTLQKLYGVTSSMRSNQKTYQDWIPKHPGIQDICLQPKFDGCSVAVDFTTKRFFTRGDYDDGKSVDVTDIFIDHLKNVQTYAEYGTIAMKFEAIMSHEAFVSSGLDTVYKRARDAVAATITSRNTEQAQYITLVPLRGYLQSGDEYIPRALYTECTCLFTLPTDYDGMESFIKQCLSDDATVKFKGQTYSIDGVVASSFTDKNTIVCTHPEDEVAIKILYNVQTTKLINVEYQFGKQGRITPVAILEPVKFDNVTVDHVTLSTLDRVLELKLRHNDTVRVMYNIVPYLIDSEHDGDYPIQIPNKCPICGAQLEFTTLKQVKCSNPNCKGLRLGAIIRHAEKMKMVGVSRGIITKLFDEGMVTKIEDLYHLRDRDVDDGLRSLDGFGDKSVMNLLSSIEKALHEATLPRFLGALQFADTSEETWKAILKVMNEYELIRSMVDGTFPDTIMSVGYIPTVGELKLSRIINGYLLNKDEIISMMRWIPSKLKPSQQIPVRGKIGMTGTRDPELTRELTDSGYEVGSFTNDCVALIVPFEGYTSAKTEKAQRLNIPIYTIEQADQLLVVPF